MVCCCLSPQVCAGGCSMGSLFGRAKFSAGGSQPPLASLCSHLLLLCGKKQVLFMVGKGGQAASIWYCEKQELAKAPVPTPAPFCTLPLVGKTLLTKRWSPHEAAQALVVHNAGLLLRWRLPF